MVARRRQEGEAFPSSVRGAAGSLATVADLIDVLGAEIQVVYSSLLAAAQGLESAKGALDEVASKNDAMVGAAAAAGHPAVSSALTSFLHTWQYGASHMKSDAEHLRQALSVAGERYKAVDQAIAQEAAKMKSGSSR